MIKPETRAFVTISTAQRMLPLLLFDEGEGRETNTRQGGGEATCLLSQALNPAAGSMGHFHNPEQKSH